MRRASVTIAAVAALAAAPAGAQASEGETGGPIKVGTATCYVVIEGWPPPPITIDLSEPPFVTMGYGPGVGDSYVHCPIS